MLHRIEKTNMDVRGFFPIWRATNVTFLGLLSSGPVELNATTKSLSQEDIRFTNDARFLVSDVPRNLTWVPVYL